MFHVIQDAYCITRNKKCVYKQAKLYRYNEGLYVGMLGGFVRLLTNGDMATPDCSYVEVFIPPELGLRQSKDNIGRLTVENA